MSMTSIAQRQGELARSGATDEQMEQIRELLVGNLLRHSEARIAALEARLKELEGELGRGLDLLAARIEALGTEMTAERHRTFEELSRSVGELGERIRNLSRS